MAMPPSQVGSLSIRPYPLPYVRKFVSRIKPMPTSTAMKIVVPMKNITMSFMLITDLILRLRAIFSRDTSLVVRPILVEAATQIILILPPLQCQQHTAPGQSTERW